MSLLWQTLFLAVFLRVFAALPQCSDVNTETEFDYAVVGAGAGGGPLAARLAESGFSVLVIDAGHDVHNVNTTIPLYFARATEDPQISLDYTLDEYPPGFRFQKNDALYPRSRGVGGSTIHNAMINVIAATRSDFDGLADMFNDSTWSRDNMQEYYKKIERNKYTLPGPDHGQDGWLTTTLNPLLAALNPKFLDVQTVAYFAALAISDVPLIDFNVTSNDDAVGGSLPSFTIDEHHNRSSVRERLLDVEQSSGRLTFSLDTLATKILMCNGTDGKPTAYGVEMAPGAGLAVASNFNGKVDLDPILRNVTVRREVIVSAGVFQSPQLLMLSGIGDSSQLEQFGIESVVHLPGVGTNLQGKHLTSSFDPPNDDSSSLNHDEIAIIYKMKQNFSIWNGCTFLYTLEDDPCLAFWQETGGANIYSFSGAFEVTTSRSVDSPTPDIFAYYAPAYFPGFVRGVSNASRAPVCPIDPYPSCLDVGFQQELIDRSHNHATVINLKAHPSSKGSVRLTGAHPQDPLDIQKNRFQAEEGPQDVADLREAIKRSMAVMNNLLIEGFIEGLEFPESLDTDEEIEDHIYQNIFGHHACCTNPMGTDDDPNAVLDGDFNVRGVNNLRVVDASTWKIVPGYFITTPIYMISEKAADVILAAAKAD
ncbi:hypothetical protein D9758_003404 [Tetrapyrgos nigripes]|uniref:Choline dehydrogenase n=1 Tax=Tetrapyrgos nigripes TaxID=182062 RepID=A0A8H5LW94_9AGAR|nr:hypothetical protein D9758_003404 [Tetrapyrgos nigripes]